MSFLNIFVDARQALVAVDTEGVAASGARLEAAKLVPMLPIGAVLAIRGSAALPGLAYHVMIQHCPQSFDDAMAVAGDVVRSTLALLDQAAAHHALPPPGEQQIALVGWSKLRGRMVAVVYTGQAGAGDIARDEVQELWAAPSPDVEVDDWDSEAGMVQLFRAQRDWRVRHEPRSSGGGRMVLAELTRDAVNLRVICPDTAPSR